MGWYFLFALGRELLIGILIGVWVLGGMLARNSTPFKLIVSTSSIFRNVIIGQVASGTRLSIRTFREPLRFCYCCRTIMFVIVCETFTWSDYDWSVEGFAQGINCYFTFFFCDDWESLLAS